MHSAFRTEIVRSITRSWTRFLAIFAIVALGAGTYAGLRMCAPDMRLTVDRYLDDTAFMDVHLVSTLGFSDADVRAVGRVKGVAEVTPTHIADVTATIGDRRATIRVHALDAGSGPGSEAGGLNRPLLVAGRWPRASGECVIDHNKLYAGAAQIGQKVTLMAGTRPLEDTFATTEFTIVGIIDSSYYLSFDRGTTTLNDGSIDRFMYVPSADFADRDTYSDLFVRVRRVSAVSTFAAAYGDIVDPVIHSLEALAPGREQARLAEVKDAAQRALDEKRADYERARSEADARLADGRAQLDAAAAKIAASAADLASGEKRYDAGVAKLALERRTFAAQSADAQAALDASATELAANQAALDELASAIAGLQQQVTAVESTVSELQAALDAAVAAEALGETPVPGSAELAVSLADAQAQLLAVQQALAAQSAVYQAGLASLTTARAQLDAQVAALASGAQQAEAQFASAQCTLTASRRTLREGAAALADARASYEQAVAAYESGRADTERQLSDALAAIDEGQSEVDGIELPTWYVLGRDTNAGYASLKVDADRIEAISRVFPFIFFVVAALVALTTMTRMVDEEQTLIGTYKALGYGRGRIAAKYLTYAGLASVLGSVVGIAAGSQAFPKVVWRAYTTMYTAPAIETPIDRPIALLAAAALLVVTLGATLLAVEATLRESPAALMLPRAPRPGKRIFLERVTPVWSRLSFSRKVTARNLFRYKKRLLMTVVGIAGCTALLLTGFGLRDSIADVLGKQYGEIDRYDTIIGVDPASWEATSAVAGAGGGVKALLDDPAAFSRYLVVHLESVRIESAARDAGGVKDTSASATALAAGAATADQSEAGVLDGYLCVPADPGRIAQFIRLRDRRSGTALALTGDGAIITEKAARELGLRVGDRVRVERTNWKAGDRGPEAATLAVAGITEQYVSHYVYITPRAYEHAFGEPPSRNLVLGKAVATRPAAREALSQSLLQKSGVTTVQFTTDITSSFDDMLKSLDSVVFILIFSAGMLAFIVLYNLTNINVTERTREIATIKVLGFYDSEVNAYIYRETAALALIGCALGLLLGIVLEAYVITTVEIDIVMFGRTIHPPSYLYSAALTLAFAVIVNLAMAPRLRRIDMVESLKSVE